jgi:hypothetical protein
MYMAQKNIVSSPTCYKGDSPTLLDIVITNAHRNLQNTICIECDLSDFHHMVCFATKQYAPIRTKRTIMYRSYKKFNEVMFSEELGQAPYQVSEIFEDVNDSYWFCETLTKSIMDAHAPNKNRIIKTTKCHL